MTFHSYIANGGFLHLDERIQIRRIWQQAVFLFAQRFSAQRFSAMGYAALGALIFFGSLEAQATIVTMHTIEEMTQKADVVVHARVVDQKVEKDNARIVTRTQIEVIDGLKGATKGDVLTIYQVGGTYEGKTQRIIGTHTHQMNEEMILFAMKYRDGLISYGVGVGKFLVERIDGSARIVEDIQDVSILKRGKNGRNELAEPTPRENPSVEGFKKQLTDFLTKPRLTSKQRKLRVLPKQKRLLLKRNRGGE